MLIQVEFRQKVNTDLLNGEELLALKHDLDEAVALIAYQIDEAKSKALVEGEYADSQWFAKAKLALRLKRQASQKVQEIIRKRRKVDTAQQMDVSQFFLDICREKMEPELFHRILEAAQRRKDAWVRSTKERNGLEDGLEDD